MFFSPIEHYPFLDTYRLSDPNNERQSHCMELRGRLHDAWRNVESEVDQSLEYVALREHVLIREISNYYKKEHKKIVQYNLKVQNSFEILAMNTHLIDSIIETCFEYALEDLHVLKECFVSENTTELHYKERVLPEKKAQQKGIQEQIHFYSGDGREARQMRRYYQKIQTALEKEIDELQKRIEQLSVVLPLIEECTHERKEILKSLVIFARGGYGRAELSFASDLDLGYCLDTQRLNEGEVVLLQELIIRIEQFLRESGLETAHQYFEIDEDLSRFREPESIDTIPSILESRVLLGSKSLAETLKRNFFKIIPYETYVLTKLKAYHSATKPALNEMNLKEDQGGLRSLQIPLWIAAATFGAFPDQTVGMLALLIQKQMLSPKQALKLCQALEFIYELRNFTGVAKSFYYDDEVRDLGCSEEGLQKNIINDSMERLYLLKKQRFTHVDDFDRFRLRMVGYLHDLSHVLLQRLLDQTIVRTFSSFQLRVHLGKGRIVEVHALEGLPQVPPSLIFDSPCVLLELFIYIGNSGYDLSFDLKDEFSDSIDNFTPEIIEANQDLVSKQFTELMLTENVSHALKIMFKICAPDSTRKMHSRHLPDTLIGRFIPECNQMRFLLRNLTYHQHSLCEHTLNALKICQKELELFKKEYTELYNYLTPKYILALKWGLFLHDVGKIDPSTKHEISGTAIAIKVLKRLGYDDPELFKLVSLLIAHHMTVVRLSKTSAYFDMALYNFFEVADRDLIKVILLFLVNLSDYSAVSDTTAKDTAHLRKMFAEAYQVYLEMKSLKDMESSIDFIHDYLDNKKAHLELDTRIAVLINKSLQESLLSAVLEPLEEKFPSEYKSLQSEQKNLERLIYYLRSGSLDSKGVDQNNDQMIRILRQHLSKESILDLTHDLHSQINWMFEVFPNRFLIASNPDVLYQTLISFGELDAPAIVSMQTNARGRLSGVLIYVHKQESIHSRVAYVLDLQQINIISGKMNQIRLSNGEVRYCYYFEVSQRTQSGVIFPREIEESILNDTLPDVEEEVWDSTSKSRLQVEFLEDDHKGYVIEEDCGYFRRCEMDYMRVSLTAVDEPLVYYKMTDALEAFGVDLQQTLITTTGYQGINQFYFNAKDYEKLKESAFEERIKSRFLIHD